MRRTLAAVLLAGLAAGLCAAARAAGPAGAPVVSGVEVTAGERYASITWQSSEPSSSQVEYGPSTAYGWSSWHFAALVTTHTVILAGLEASTTYHFRVASRSASGLSAISGDFLFVTQDSMATAVVPGLAQAAPAPAAASGVDDFSASQAPPASAAPAGAVGYVGPPDDDDDSSASSSPAAAATAAPATGGIVAATPAPVPAAAIGGAPTASAPAPAPAATGTSAPAASSAQPASSSSDPARAAQKFLSPAFAGPNAAAVFGPTADRVTIVDIRGRKVFEGSRGGGPITWNCRDGAGRVVESGVYIARIVKDGGGVIYQSFAVVK